MCRCACDWGDVAFAAALLRAVGGKRRCPGGPSSGGPPARDAGHDADLYASESAWPGCPGLGRCAVVPRSVPQRRPRTIGLRSVKLCEEWLLDPVAQLVEQRTFNP